ncbi:MAG: hypothetical protein GC184_14545 [Rhizobiales bacterium]|nr:hypothetical protein [Hyphomicrobiales bacterium]
MTRFAVALIILLLSPVSAIASSIVLATTDKVIPVASLAGGSTAVLRATLGAPESCDEGKYGLRCTYMEGAVEVVFIAGAADWFTIYPSTAMMTRASLSQLGLPNAVDPDVDTGDQMRWEGLSGLREVAAYAGEGGRVSYFYVKALTP